MGSKGKKNIEEMDRAIYGNARVQQYKTDIAFKTLMEGVEDNLYIIPDFQRVYKWKQEQVEELAVSLIRGLPIPPIYTYRNDQGELEILDGQQRVISMYLYYKGKYKKESRKIMDLKNLKDENRTFEKQLDETYGLKDVSYVMKYYDMDSEQEKEVDITYKNLPKKVKSKLDYTTITVVEINIDDKELKNKYLYKIFANLNAGGVPLTKQEIRNGIYRSPFYDMLFEMNQKNEKWRTIIPHPENYSRSIEYLLRLCAFKYYVKIEEDKFIISSYKNIEKMLNDFSENAIRFSDEQIAEYKNSLEVFFDLYEGKINQISLFENVFTVVNKKNYTFKITPDILNCILGSNEYRDTIRNGNATKAVIETKLKVVYDELQKYA